MPHAPTAQSIITLETLDGLCRGLAFSGASTVSHPPVPVAPPPAAPHPPARPQEARISTSPPSPGPNLPDLCHASKHFVCKLSGRGVGALTCHVPRWSLCCPDPRLGCLGMARVACCGAEKAGHPHPRIIASSNHLRASVQQCSDLEVYKSVSV